MRIVERFFLFCGFLSVVAVDDDSRRRKHNDNKTFICVDTRQAYIYLTLLLIVVNDHLNFSIVIVDWARETTTITFCSMMFTHHITSRLPRRCTCATRCRSACPARRRSIISFRKRRAPLFCVSFVRSFDNNEQTKLTMRAMNATTTTTDADLGARRQIARRAPVRCRRHPHGSFFVGWY